MNTKTIQTRFAVSMHKCTITFEHIFADANLNSCRCGWGCCRLTSSPLRAHTHPVFLGVHPHDRKIPPCLHTMCAQVSVHRNLWFSLFIRIQRLESVLMPADDITSCVHMLCYIIINVLFAFSFNLFIMPSVLLKCEVDLYVSVVYF